MARKKKTEPKVDPATLAFYAGVELAKKHPVCFSLIARTNLVRDQRSKCPRDGWAVVFQSGTIHVHPSRRAEPKEWAHVMAHALLHLGFGHFVVGRENDRAWQAACDVVVERFLQGLKVGEPIADGALPGGNEESLYRSFRERGVPPEILARGTTGAELDMVYDHEPEDWWGRRIDFTKVFALGLMESVADAVEIAGGTQRGRQLTPAMRAKQWFVANYPLLGAMAAAFTIVEDAEICRRLDIAVAAVDPLTKEIFMNPAAAMDESECRFVMAHELLHVGLRHGARCEGRDPYLWNVACDFVINAWLVEMGVGTMPQFGGLYDSEMAGMSAEAIYDQIVRDIRTYRKLATLRGYGCCDILAPEETGRRAAGEDVDAFCRRALAQGLALHQREDRGLLPSGLIEEIEALSVPPIPWDVRLAQWFDGFFGPVEPRRTYARASRRQSATPEIPRPRVIFDPSTEMGRTFGVVLDTSGSMDRRTLALGLGAISSYAISRDVPFVRLVFCDANAYDEGYVAPETIASRVRVKGRGGTILQPGIDLLERSADFPPDGPILIVTDGKCDRLRIARPHAFLMPDGARLPFIPHGPVFEIVESDR